MTMEAMAAKEVRLRVVSEKVEARSLGGERTPLIWTTRRLERRVELEMVIWGLVCVGVSVWGVLG
jgi:hypothetical protein